MTGGELVVVLIAAVVASVIKGTTGMGYPLVLLPALALFIDLVDAIVIVAPSNLAVNIVLAWRVRASRRNSPTLPRFAGASIAGGLVGAFLLPGIPDVTLRLLLVAVIGLFVLTRWRTPEWRLGRAAALPLAAPVGALAGLSQGATGVSGPIVTPWFLAQRLERDAFIFSITAVYGLSGAAQIVGVAVAGLFTAELLAVGAALVPIALVSIPVGEWLRGRLTIGRFERLVVGLLVLSAVTLVARMI